MVFREQGREYGCMFWVREGEIAGAGGAAQDAVSAAEVGPASQGPRLCAR
jgi:hypothetical protein